VGLILVQVFPFPDIEAKWTGLFHPENPQGNPIIDSFFYIGLVGKQENKA